MSEYICPHCGKPVYDDEALLCLYCGEDLQRGVGFLGRIKYPKPRVMTAIIVALVISAFMLFMLMRR